MTGECDKCGDESDRLKTVIEGTKRQSQCPDCRNVQVVRVEVELEIDRDKEKPVEAGHQFVMNNLNQKKDEQIYSFINRVKHDKSIGIHNY